MSMPQPAPRSPNASSEGATVDNATAPPPHLVADPDAAAPQAADPKPPPPTWRVISFLGLCALLMPAWCILLGELHELVSFFGAAAAAGLMIYAQRRTKTGSSYTMGATLVIWVAGFFTYAVTNDYAKGGDVAKDAAILDAPSSRAHGFLFRDAKIDISRAYEWKEERRATGVAAPADSTVASIWFTIAPFVRDGAPADEPISAWAVCVDGLEPCTPRMRLSHVSGRAINEVYRKSIDGAVAELTKIRGVQSLPGAVILEVDPDPKSASYYYALNYAVTSLVQFLLLGLLALLARRQARLP